MSQIKTILNKIISKVILKADEKTNTLIIKTAKTNLGIKYYR